MHHNQLQGVEYVEARVTLFPNQYKKVYSSLCIYAKATDNPLKVEKKINFFVPWPVAFIGKYCHRFRSLHCRRMQLECKYYCLQFYGFDKLKTIYLLWPCVWFIWWTCIEIGFKNDVSVDLVTEWSNASEVELWVWIPLDICCLLHCTNVYWELNIRYLFIYLTKLTCRNVHSTCKCRIKVVSMWENDVHL